MGAASRARAWVAAALVAVALACAPAASGATPTVTELRIPFPFSAPHGIVTGWDGNVWFTQHGRNALGRIPPDATSGAQITEHGFGVPGEGAYGAEGIAAGADGRLWFALNDGVPSSSYWLGSMTQGASPAGALHTLSAAAPKPSEIAAGRDNRLWFTRGGAANSIGRISPFSPFPDGHFAIPTVPTAPTPSRGIAAGPDGNLWFTWQSKVGRATTASTPAITMFETGATPQQIAAGPDGNLWFTQTGPAAVSRITPTGTVTAFALPGTFVSPDGIAAGPDGSLWFTEGGGGQIGRISPHGDDTAIEGSIAVFRPLTTPSFVTPRIAPGPDGALWFTGTDAVGRKVGRITTALDPPQARTPLGGAPIAVPGAGAAAPYPSSLTVSGIAAPVGAVRVDLYGLFHAWPEDLDVMLVGPRGQKAMVLSDAGLDRSVFGSSLTIEDAAPFAAPRDGILVSGRYRPTDHEPGESLPAPAPAGPYAADLSVFAGTDPNGTWRLYAADDSSLISGRLLGWGLHVTPADPEEPPDPETPTDPEGPPPDSETPPGTEPPGSNGPSPIAPGTEPPSDGPPAGGRRAGFVAGTRQVLVDARGRALVELACPAGEKSRCAIKLSGVTSGPLRVPRGRRRSARPLAAASGRRRSARPLAVPARRFTVPAGRVRAVPLPLPARLRRVLGARGPRLRLVAVHKGSRATATVALRPATAALRRGRDGRVRVLVPHAGDAKRLRVRIAQGTRTVARRVVARPRRGRVVPLRIRLTAKPRGSRRLRIEVTTVPVAGRPRVLAYGVRLAR